ncbi:hypothetical protein [Ruegeria atlantica]|uniref:hypothetical protein n=1 Tax=Ruegeria atlantica TaxID=81569 RepID=UPI00147E734D|nr:hypothetical protein [Ruegeria atlantica]
MNKAPYAIRQCFKLLLVVCGLQVSAQTVWADLWWPALGWNCDEEARHLVAYPVYFDANQPVPDTREGFYVPMADGWENADDEVPVFSCHLGPSLTVEVVRIRLKLPSARGICGAGAYSDYSLRINGEESAHFAIGCSASTFLKISENYGEICDTAQSADPCRPLRESVFLKLNAFGHFEERQQ